MNKIDFAIERVFRFFEDQKRVFECYVVQIAINKNLISTDYYKFVVTNINNEKIYEVMLFINPVDGKVIENHSHEDPLISTDNDYLICLQLSTEILSSIQGEVNISFGKVNDNPLGNYNVKDIKNIFTLQNRNYTYSSINNDYYLLTNKD